jgi:hypothetical protein
VFCVCGEVAERVKCNYSRHARFFSSKMLANTGLLAGIAQSVQRLVTCWTVRGSNQSAGDIFRTRPDRPWGPCSFLYNGYWVFFLGIKRPGRGVNHPTPSSAEVKENVEQHLYSPSGPSFFECAQARNHREIVRPIRTIRHVTFPFRRGTSPFSKVFLMCN